MIWVIKSAIPKNAGQTLLLQYNFLVTYSNEAELNEYEYFIYLCHTQHIFSYRGQIGAGH